MNSDMSGMSGAQLQAALAKAKEIETTLRHALSAAERRARDELVRVRAELRGSQEAEQRARDRLRLLGVSGAFEGSAAPRYSPTSYEDVSPRSPVLARAGPSPPYPYSSPVLARAGPLNPGSPPYSSPVLARAGSPPCFARSPQYSPRAAAPAALEAFDAEQLEALSRDVRAALARVELAQERHRERLEAEEAVGSEAPHFCCPVGLRLMRKPVMLGDGLSYEAEAIKEWFRQQDREHKRPSSPMTRAPVSTKLVLNRNLQNAIDVAVEVKQAELRKRKREREPQD